MPPLLLQPTLGMAAPTTLPARAPGAGTPSALHLCSTHPGPQRRYPAGCPPLRRAVAAGSTSPAGTSSSSVGPRITDKPAVPARLWGRLPGPGGDKAASTPTVVAQAVLNSKPSASNVAPTQQRSGGGGGDVPPEEEDTWGIFDAKRYKYRWDVPWGWGVIAGGMVAWQVTFVLVGFVAVPLAYRLADIDIPSLGPDGRAQFTLIAQVAETVTTLGLFHLITAGRRAETPDGAPDLFNYDPRGPFRKPTGWLTWAALGIVLSPVLVGTVASLVEATGYETQVSGNGTVDGVATMINVNLPTYLSLLSVTGILAPLLEETVFRGFLLTSLSKFMPTWAAVVASSVGFGIAHFSLRDLPVLCALGMLLGFTYVRSRNLLTPMLVHGAWNSAVLTLLFVLVASGVDVEAVIKEMRTTAPAGAEADVLTALLGPQLEMLERLGAVHAAPDVAAAAVGAGEAAEVMMLPLAEAPEVTGA